MTDEQRPEIDVDTSAAEQRIEVALEKLWRQGRAKTMLSIPSPAVGEIRVVKWRHPE